jgi:hypothetical protein
MFNPPITGDMPLDSYLYDLHLALEANTAALDSSVVPPDLAAGEPGTYIYRYIAVKYADDNIGTNLSDSPTNRSFFGIFNSSTTVESTNPADYTWYEASVPFSTNRSLYYLILGGRQIKFEVGLTASDYHWKGDNGSAIDLDVLVPDNTLSTNQIINGAITTDKLNAGAVTADKTNLAAISAITGYINPNTIDTAQIVNNAITNLKVLDGAITANKTSLAALDNTLGNLKNDTVSSANIVANAITEAKIATSAITETKIASDSITSPKIVANAIVADKIASSAVIADKIASNAITSDKISANAVIAGKIATDAVTTNTIAAGSIVADKLAADSVTSNAIAANSVVAVKIAAGAIIADKIDAGAVTADKISTGAIIADKISAGAVTASKIDTGAVTATKINVASLSAVSTETGNLTVGATGSVKGGQTDFNTGSGFFLGYSGSAYKFSVGDSSQGLTWNGSSMSIVGNIYGVGAARFTGVNSIGSLSAIDANSGYAATIGVLGRGGGYAGRGIVGSSDGGTGSVGVIGVSGGSASESGVTAVGSGGSAALRVEGGPIVIDNTSLVNNLNVQYLNGQEASAFVNVASGTSNGKYLYYVNNNTAPSNTTTMAAWIKVQTNDGAVVWIPGYF